MPDPTPTYLIAELGSTWAGDPERAAALIHQAADAGFDAVKFHWTSNPARLATRRNAPELAPAYQGLAWPAAWHAEFAEECQREGVEYMSTAYLPEDIAVVAPHVSRFKIASFEATDEAFLSAHAGYGKPVLVSTGMHSEDDLFDIAALLNSKRMDWTMLHCVSSYPAPVDQVNLAAIGRRDNGCDVLGFSDHTAHVLTGACAVAAGAEVIEVHVRLDDTDPLSPDYGHSLTPEQFREYAANCRIAESMMGSGEKRVMDCERPNLRYQVRGDQP